MLRCGAVSSYSRTTFCIGNLTQALVTITGSEQALSKLAIDWPLFHVRERVFTLYEDLRVTNGRGFIGARGRGAMGGWPKAFSELATRVTKLEKG